MKKLTFDEMEIVTASGCGWLRRQYFRASRAGEDQAATSFANLYLACVK